MKIEENEPRNSERERERYLVVRIFEHALNPEPNPALSLKAHSLRQDDEEDSQEEEAPEEERKKKKSEEKETGKSSCGGLKQGKDEYWADVCFTTMSLLPFPLVLCEETCRQ